jgi:hypothetical protein
MYEDTWAYKVGSDYGGGIRSREII